MNKHIWIKVFTKWRAVLCIILVIGACPAEDVLADSSGIHYVNVNNLTPLPPYTNWATAATEIQSAVDAAAAGDTVLVTNGIYEVGGRMAVDQVLTNRVVIDKAITVESVHGAEVTVIKGAGPLGDGAVRCVWLADGATLVGFTLTNGGTRSPFGDPNGYGGGLYAQSVSGVVSNCVLAGNLARSGSGAYGGTLNNCNLNNNMASYGGGARDSILNNCTVSSNSAAYGGGTYAGTLNNCTVWNNDAGTGGGTYFGTLNNCIVYFNTAATSNNCFNGTINYTCTTPLPPGEGNIDSNPLFVDAAVGNCRLLGSSPCFNAGKNANAPGTSDLDGNPRIAHGTVDMGAYESVEIAYPVGTHFVSLTSTSPAAPYTDWSTAATNIQDAIDVASPGDTVLVANGVYDTGGRAAAGELRNNRVLIDKAITVESVNGQTVTTIDGKAAMRCVWVTDGAILAGFTITNGLARNDDFSDDSAAELDARGGGVYAQSRQAVVNNCTITGNRSENYGFSFNGGGGGVFSGTLNSCTVIGNSAEYGDGGGAFGSTLNSCMLTLNSTGENGGGASDSTLNNCSIVKNSAGRQGGGTSRSTLNNCMIAENEADDGGGAHSGSLHNCTITKNTAGESGGGALRSTLNNCTITKNTAGRNGGGAHLGSLNNCIAYYNDALSGMNYYGGVQSYSCTTPLPPGVGNITNAPRLASSTHIGYDSPCRGGGSATYASGVDMDGESWASPPAIGADEPMPSSSGPLTVSIDSEYNTVSTGFRLSLNAEIEGIVTSSVWDFGDGFQVTNQAYAAHAWEDPGTYDIVLTASNAGGSVSTTNTITVVDSVIHYVDVSGIVPIFPYTNWATAANTIQDAVDAATPGATILVTNGVYETGGRAAAGQSLTNRVVIDKAITVQSVNGRGVTTIKGNVGVRCVWMRGAVAVRLAGFTLTNASISVGGHVGGGLYAESSLAVVSDCTITGNSASEGGGAYGASIKSSTITGNSAFAGGGAYKSLLNDCILRENSATGAGGGAFDSLLNNCTLIKNSVESYGGGASDSTLNNCTVTENTGRQGGGANVSTLNGCAISGNTGYWGGGARNSTLNNCTVTGNSARYGGGLIDSVMRNCIVYYNDAFDGMNYYGKSDSISYSCSTPVPPGESNIDVAPELLSSTHIERDSPCRARGSTNYVTGVDIDGEEWGSPPSIGADEPLATSGGPLTVFVDAQYTAVSANFSLSLKAEIEGAVISSVWDFGDGYLETNTFYTTHAWSTTGTYDVVLTAYNVDHPEGVSATVRIIVPQASDHFVAVSNATPSSPYSSWATAANVIQDAIDSAIPGDTVWVTNGVYDTGQHAAHETGNSVNRVVITNAVRLISVNGPDVTIIRGSKPNGPGAVRCAYVGQGGTLTGFTLANGGSLTEGDEVQQKSGGGVWCDASGLVSNCTITANSAASDGGGAFGGMLIDCLVSENNAVRGGGAFVSRLRACVISGNSATDGGGVYECILDNCMVAKNSGFSGGGARFCRPMKNCTITENTGGGVINSDLYNCILYDNLPRSGGNIINYDGNSTLSYSCTFPLPPGEGNINSAPAFMDSANGEYSLSPMSPCIDVGITTEDLFDQTDLLGNPRVLNQRVDMGTYEFFFDATLKIKLEGAE